MEKIYDIAVIGESMSGKTTWISNLFRDDIAERLHEKCKKNREGQTGLSVWYLIKDATEMEHAVQSISWDMEVLNEAVKDGNMSVAVRRLSNIVELPLGEEPANGQIYKQYSPTSKLSNRQLSVDEIFSEIVNDDAISSTGIISSVEIMGPAALEVCRIMQDFGLDGVRLRDTRGFLNEAPGKMQEYFEKGKVNENKEEYLQKLLRDRGLFGIDGCVFMSRAGVDTLHKKNYRTVYGPLIQNLLRKYPVFLTVRTDRVMELYEKNPNISYEELIKKGEKESDVRLGKYFTGFDTLHELFVDYGLFEKTGDCYTDIAGKHYKELVLANIPMKMMEKNPDEETNKQVMEWYQKNVIGVFTEVLSGVSAYYNELADTEEYMPEYSDALKPLFDEYFISNIEFIKGREVYLNKLLGALIPWLTKGIKGMYFGDMVGSRGGVTTQVPYKIEKPGDIAIAFLKSAYYTRGKLLPELIDQLEPEIVFHVQKKMSKNCRSMDEMVRCMKWIVFFQFRKETKANSEELGAAEEPMISRRYLLTAYDNTRRDLEINNRDIGTCLPELELPPRHLSSDESERWEEGKYEISAVKDLLWRLVCLQT